MKPRRLLPSLVFFAVLVLALFLHRCSTKPTSVSISQSVDGFKHEDVPPDAPTKPITMDTLNPILKPNARRGNPAVAPTPDAQSTVAPNTPAVASPAIVSQPDTHDSIPYVYADPWGGRHFDSVTVNLHCAEDCPVYYSLQDSVNLHPYTGPVSFKTTTTIWFTGVSAQGRRAPIVQLDYVIEKNPRYCPDGAMPVAIGGHEICVDAYEWPNREGAKPAAMMTQDQAQDSCQRVGKHLCSAQEWQSACHGPEESVYPYGDTYNERYCPAQESEPSRSGRFPACRSYYGLYDLAGNMWEWTSSKDPQHKDFYLVVGGNWSTADNATCGVAKYSFYPQNRYPTVGFRCCAEAK